MWDMPVKRIVIQQKRMEKRQIAEGRRNGAANTHGTEVERDDSIRVMAAASDGSPVAEGDCGTPVDHGTMRIAGNIVLKFQERLLIIMMRVRREGK